MDEPLSKGEAHLEMEPDLGIRGCMPTTSLVSPNPAFLLCKGELEHLGGIGIAMEKEKISGNNNCAIL